MAPTARSPMFVAFGGLFSLAAAMGIGRFVYTPILPFMSASVPLGPADAGLIASANFLGYLAGAFAASLGFLPGSHRAWFLGALAVSALTTAAMAFTTALAMFVVLRFGGGVASAFVLVFSSTLVLERLSVAGRPNLSAFHFGGVGCGITLSAVAVALLAGHDFSWRGLWIASATMTLLCLGLAAWLVPAGPSLQPATAPKRKPTGKPNVQLIRLIVAYGLFGFGYVITATFMSVIVRDSPALNPAEPYVWLAVGLTAAPSVYVWNTVASVTGATRAFSIACILEAGGVALSVVAGTSATVITAAVLLGGTFMGITALGLTEARRLSPGAQRQTLAVITACFGVGQMIGPLVAGVLGEATGSFATASFAAAAALVVAAVLVWR